MLGDPVARKPNSTDAVDSLPPRDRCAAVRASDWGDAIIRDRAEIAQDEAKIDDIVRDLSDLTPDDIALLESVVCDERSFARKASHGDTSE